MLLQHVGRSGDRVETGIATTYQRYDNNLAGVAALLSGSVLGVLVGKPSLLAAVIGVAALSGLRGFRTD